MLGHYLVTYIRMFRRRAALTLLNILGLAIGFAVFLVLMLDVRFETSFEAWIPAADEIYQVRTDFVDDPAIGTSDGTAGGLWEELHNDYPLLLGTRVLPLSATVRQAGQVTSEVVHAVDPDFFKVFDLPLIAGDRDRALASPTGIVLTAIEARKYFGDADPLGQSLTLTIQGTQRPYQVVGVMPTLPDNTDQSFDFLMLLTPEMSDKDRLWQHFDFVSLYTYLKFKTPAEANGLAGNLDHFVDTHSTEYLPLPGHDHIQLRVQPLRSMHLMDAKSAAVVAALALVGVLTAMLSAVNYVTLATVGAGLRSREVALRKVMGASPASLRAQFMGEALATVALAGLLALVICEFALPFVNAAGGLALKLDYRDAGGVVPLMIGAVLVVGLGAGFYPALLLSRFQPAAVLAASRSASGGRAGGRMREALVMFQFAVAIAFTIGAGVIASQTNFVRQADLGFQRGGLIVVNSFSNDDVTDDQRSGLLAAWRGLPDVTSISAGSVAPGAEMGFSRTIHRPGAAGDGPWLKVVTIGPAFFEVYGVRLIAGRLLDSEHGDDNFIVPAGAGSKVISNDAVDTPKGFVNIVVNTNSISSLGFANAEDALGKTVEELDDGKFVRSYMIVGVVDNFRFGPPSKKIPDALYRMSLKEFGGELAAVRYRNVDPRAMIEKLQEVWYPIVPDTRFDATTAEESLQHYYDSDVYQGHLFAIGASMAVVIACMGLFGLASFNTQRRYKEIGVRKALGASTADLLRLLLAQILRPVLIANLVAWPLAFFTVRGWLAGFDQRVGLSPLLFIGATLLALAVACLTVIGHSWGLARAKPAKALHYE
jgi:putative ABC transport system permease protein